MANPSSVSTSNKVLLEVPSSVKSVYDTEGDWRGLQGYIVDDHSGIACGIAPTGSITAAGAITLGTALDHIYSEGIWLALPSGTVVGDAATTIHWVVMSSTTAGQVFSATLTAGQKAYIPTNPINAVGSGAAYTGVTGSAIPLNTLTMPGGTMGPNGYNTTECLFSNNNSVNNKTIGVTFGGQSVLSVAMTSNITASMSRETYNRGVQNAQITGPSSLFGHGQSTSAVSKFTIDTTADVNISATGTLAVDTDWVICQSIVSINNYGY